jgi:hypothetical protein
MRLPIDKVRNPARPLGGAVQRFLRLQAWSTGRNPNGVLQGNWTPTTHNAW